MRDDYIGRMYNITRNTNLNYDNCDWANSTCAVRATPASLQRASVTCAGCPLWQWQLSAMHRQCQFTRRTVTGAGSTNCLALCVHGRGPLVIYEAHCGHPNNQVQGSKGGT
jgi:hypothetical protein